MIGEQPNRDHEPVRPEGADSAAQLRREAAKARALAEAAFGEEEQRQLVEVALTLEREANAIEAAIVRKRKAERTR